MIALLALALAAAAPGTPAQLARGQYLSNLCECFSCHSPLRDLPYEEPVAGMLGAGDILSKEQRKVAPNLTPDRETGAGAFTDEQWLRAIRAGIGHDGRKLSLAMPYDYFSVMTDEDAAALIAYMRSLTSVRHALPKWIPTDAAEPPPDALLPPARPKDLEAPVARGAYLAHLARCVLCHSARPAGETWRHRRADMEFGGGRRFSTKPFFDELDPDEATTAPSKTPEPAGSVVVSANITQDASGIAYYDRAVFIQTIRSGRVAGIRPLSNAMPWRRFRHLTDDDLGAIFAYLQAVPQVRHRVNNTDPPTWCPRCGRVHGLGELNRP